MKEIIQEVVQKKYKYFYHYALKLTCNIEEAQDIAQEAILNALSKYNQFSGNEKDCEKWITTIIRNLFINKYRQESNRQDQKYDEEDKEFIKDRCESKERLWTGEYEDLMNIIDSIDVPIVDKKVFLGYYNGYLYEEIAEILELPLGSIKSKLHFIRKKIINEYGTKY